MFLLSRAVDDAVVIGECVCIRVAWLDGRRVGLSVVAPSDMRIDCGPGLRSLSPPATLTLQKGEQFRILNPVHDRWSQEPPGDDPPFWKRGDGVCVICIAFRDDRVRLGIEAPSFLLIRRHDL